MKNIAFIVIIFSQALVCYSQDIEIDALDAILELEADSVELEFIITIDEKATNKKERIEISPSFGSVQFETFKLRGEKAPGDEPIVHSRIGGKFSYRSKIKYNESILNERLSVSINRYKGGKMMSDEVEIDFHFITTSNLLKLDYKPYYSISEPVVSELKLYETYVQFSKDGYKIKESEKAKFVEISELINTISGSDSLDLSLVEVKTICPFGGDLEKITVKCEKRSNEILKELEGQLLNIKDKLKITTAAEDVDLTLELLKKHYPEDYTLIERVISMRQDPVERERELQNILGTNWFDALKPELNRSIIRIAYLVKPETYNELVKEYIEKRESVSANDLLFLAEVSDSDDFINEVLSFGSQHFSDDWRFKNNLACLQIELDQFEDADKILQSISHIKNEHVRLNLAILELNQKKFQDVLKTYMETKVSDNNVALLHFQMGEYYDAFEGISKEPSFNLALTKVMIDNYESALETLEVLEPSAEVHYLRAIALLNIGNEEESIENLRVAIKLGPEFKKRAKYDGEFAKLFGNETFRHVVNR